MNTKTALLAGISMTAFVIAGSAAEAGCLFDCANAVKDIYSNSDNNEQDVDVGSNNGSDDFEGSKGFDDNNAVAVAALQQNSVQIAASKDDEAIDDNYDAEMDFGDSTFSDQTLNNNNFNTGVNALQGNAAAVAGTSNRGFDSPGFDSDD